MKGENVFLNKGVEKVDHKNDKYCHRHDLRLDDIDHPTLRDKRLIASITYKTVKTEDKDGKISIDKMCPRCFQIVHIETKQRPLLRA